jgi:hypothetical protein
MLTESNGKSQLENLLGSVKCDPKKIHIYSSLELVQLGFFDYAFNKLESIPPVDLSTFENIRSIE